jgi:hypothetical protein
MTAYPKQPADKQLEDYQRLTPYELAVLVERTMLHVSPVAKLVQPWKLDALVLRAFRSGEAFRGIVNLFRDPLWFLFVLILFSVVASNQAVRDEPSFYFTDLLRDRITEEEFSWPDTTIRKSYKDIGEVDELYLWMSGESPPLFHSFMHVF